MIMKDTHSNYTGLAMKKTALSLLLALIVFLPGCGIRPGDVSPPPQAEPSGFPHTYPAPDSAP